MRPAFRFGALLLAVLFLVGGLHAVSHHEEGGECQLCVAFEGLETAPPSVAVEAADETPRAAPPLAADSPCVGTALPANRLRGPPVAAR